MSSALFPIPQDTPISDDPKLSTFRFGLIWQRFLKAISDDMLAANIVNNLAPTSISSPTDLTPAQLRQTAQSIKYVLNANLCFVTVDLVDATTAPIVFNLPYTALITFDISGVKYAAGTKSVTLPSGTSYVRFWYIANSQKQGV